jgi:hypothetical protein
MPWCGLSSTQYAADFLTMCYRCRSPQTRKSSSCSTRGVRRSTRRSLAAIGMAPRMSRSRTLILGRAGFCLRALDRLRDAAAAFERLCQYGHIRRGQGPSSTGFLLVSARNLMFLGLAVSLLYGIVRDVKSGCSSLASSNTPTAYSLRAMLRRIRIGSGLQRVSGRASGRSR